MSIRNRTILLIIVLACLTLAFQPIQAQSTPANPNADILWPPPTYLLSGTFTVYGTVNLPNMNGYFLEFRPLVDSVTEPGADVPWQPATLPGNTPVVNGVLGQWNTTTIPDGLYELRLTVLTTGGQYIRAQVSPVRVQNQPSLFSEASQPSNPSNPIVVPTQQQFEPTAQSSTTTSNTTSGAPMALATLDANVRYGDSTLFAEVGALLKGTSAAVLGVSSDGSGWWLIRMPSGKVGWVAPTVVQITGDASSVPSVAPPKPPTPTPTPIPTAVPILLPDGTITNVSFSQSPKVNQQFNIIVTIADLSPVALPTISVACNVTPQGTFVSTNLNGLAGNSQSQVSIPVTLTSGGGSNFTANCALDVNNLVQESSKSNNYYDLTASLSK